MKVTIDRFEGDFAVAEISENSFANIPRILLPDAKEGDIVSIIIEHKTTEEKQKENKERLHRLFNRNK